MKIERAKKMIQQLAEIWDIPKPKYFFYERLSKAPIDTKESKVKVKCPLCSEEGWLQIRWGQS